MALGGVQGGPCDINGNRPQQHQRHKKRGLRSGSAVKRILWQTCFAVLCLPLCYTCYVTRTLRHWKRTGPSEARRREARHASGLRHRVGPKLDPQEHADGRRGTSGVVGPGGDDDPSDMMSSTLRRQVLDSLSNVGCKRNSSTPGDRGGPPETVLNSPVNPDSAVETVQSGRVGNGHRVDENDDGAEGSNLEVEEGQPRPPRVIDVNVIILASGSGQALLWHMSVDKDAVFGQAVPPRKGSRQGLEARAKGPPNLRSTPESNHRLSRFQR